MLYLGLRKLRGDGVIVRRRGRGVLLLMRMDGCGVLVRLKTMRIYTELDQRNYWPRRK